MEILLVPILAWIAWITFWQKYREMKIDRNSYYVLPFSERANIIKSLLYLVYDNENKKKNNLIGTVRRGSSAAAILADFLDLKPYMVDEAIQRLIHREYLSGKEPQFRWQFTSSVQLSAEGQKFYEAYYGAPGDTYHVAPWGMVVSKSTLTNATVGNSAGESREILITETGSTNSAGKSSDQKTV